MMEATQVRSIWVVENVRHGETVGAYLHKEDAIEAAQAILDDYNCDIEDYEELERNAAENRDCFYADDLVFVEKVSYFF